MIITKKELEYGKNSRQVSDWNNFCKKIKKEKILQKDLYHTMLFVRQDWMKELEDKGLWHTFCVRNRSYEYGIVDNIFEPIIVCD